MVWFRKFWGVLALCVLQLVASAAVANTFEEATDAKEACQLAETAAGELATSAVDLSQTLSVRCNEALDLIAACGGDAAYKAAKTAYVQECRTWLVYNWVPTMSQMMTVDISTKGLRANGDLAYTAGAWTTAVGVYDECVAQFLNHEANFYTLYLGVAAVLQTVDDLIADLPPV